jgi:hypothetical protein
MAHDLMTPIERLAAYGKGEAVDRLPCVPIVGNSAARVIGAKVGEFRGNGRLIAEAQIAAYRLFGYDIIRIFTDLYTQAEAMGAKVHYPTDETAYLAAPAVADIEEIGRLRPADPHRDPNLRQHLEAMKMAVDAVGKEVAVTGAVTCPFTNASFLIGAESLARLMLKEPGDGSSPLRAFSGDEPPLCGGDHRRRLHTEPDRRHVVFHGHQPETVPGIFLPLFEAADRLHPWPGQRSDPSYLRQDRQNLGVDGRRRGGLHQHRQ